MKSESGGGCEWGVTITPPFSLTLILQSVYNWICLFLNVKYRFHSPSISLSLSQFTDFYSSVLDLSLSSSKKNGSYEPIPCRRIVELVVFSSLIEYTARWERGITEGRCKFIEKACLCLMVFPLCFSTGIS